MGYAALGHMQPVGCRLTSIWQQALIQTLGQHMAGHVQHQQHLAVQPLSTSLNHHRLRRACTITSWSRRATNVGH